jgi:hypothetical protein
METALNARVRRAFSTLLLATLLGVAGSMLAAGAATAAPRPVTAGSTPPGVPSGSVGVLGEHFVRFCVKNFKPNSPVKVVNETSGATVTIHTNSKGSGCVEVPLVRACKAVTQTIVATGTGADGTPATVKETVTAPATPSLCSSTSGGTLPFTGSSIIIPGIIIGLVLIVVGTGTVVVVRRRRDGLAG